MKTILITGASAGLGKATALLFQQKGWRVIATMRDPSKEKELQLLPNVILLPLDVTNPTQIAETAVEAMKIGVDVVFNNAGYGLVGALEACTDEQITAQINTNFTGVIRVTKAFIPYFRQKGSGLFITTTSVCGLTSNPLSTVYNATKFALEGWSECMHYELAQFNIGIKTVAPGGIKSNYMNVMEVAPHPDYDQLMKKMGEVFAEGLITFTDPEIIALSVWEAATDGKDQLCYIAGEDAVRNVKHRLEIGTEAYRIEMAERLRP
ncbi:SDR family oxidoreductase [uncultured Chitinophaga sp.]|uniref:SDR family oxidoreductase n=1 Tax=uncultured Chitinophaga sp. TaxID=339340 RepID=UPI0025ECF8C8|nr:SDR family oxidoreductase [uncultured Chitinophaga sp.]